MWTYDIWKDLFITDLSFMSSMNKLYCHWHSEKVTMQILWCSGHMDSRCSTIILFTVQEVGKTVSQMRRKKKGMWKPKRKSCADRRRVPSIFHMCRGDCGQTTNHWRIILVLKYCVMYLFIFNLIVVFFYIYILC